MWSSAPAAGATPMPFDLALGHERINRLHLDIEDGLDRFLDQRLVGGLSHLENHRIGLGSPGRFFGHDWTPDHVVEFCLGGHFSRASSASMPALVTTNRSRRRMS